MARTVAGPGLSGIGDGELGGGEDRLARRLAQLGRGRGVAGVLTLVVLDDAVEPVVGVEAALAHHPRLVRLDAEAEVG